MITVPVSPEQVEWCKAYLESRGAIGVSEYAQFLVWERDGMPKWVVAFDDWVGSTCQLYMAAPAGYAPPRSMIRTVFNHAFNVLKRTHVFGIVNSLNTRAMRLDQWLGFVQILRVQGCHTGGGDLVVFQMTPATCRWIKEARHGQEKSSAA